MSQQRLFCLDGHDYIKCDNDGERTGYYKEDSNGERDNRKVYRMIYCTKCGDNIEILVVDRTQSKEVKVPVRKKVRRK